MSEQNNTIENNNCDRCGNNREYNGECFECDIKPNMEYKECNICYESQWDKLFEHGENCEHLMCSQCWMKLQHSTCPFCRKKMSNTEEEEEEEEEVEDNSEDVTILTTNEIRNTLRNLTSMHRRVTERLADVTDQGNRDAMTILNYEVYRRIQQYRGTTRFQVRADGDFIQDNEGDWDFTTEHHAREIYNNVMEDIVAGTDSGLLNLQLTRTPALDEDDWNELFEGEAYPGLTICLEWNRLDGGDDPENYCQRCHFSLGSCQCHYPEDYEEEQNDPVNIIACRCGRECSGDDLCGHGINAGGCCVCEECQSEFEE